MKNGHIFNNATEVHEPHVVDVDTDVHGNDQFGYKVLDGKFYRVIPTTAREVLILRGLEKGRQKWAFAAGHGDGVCVTQSVVYGNLA